MTPRATERWQWPCGCLHCASNSLMPSVSTSLGPRSLETPLLWSLFLSLGDRDVSYGSLSFVCTLGSCTRISSHWDLISDFLLLLVTSLNCNRSVNVSTGSISVILPRLCLLSELVSSDSLTLFLLSPRDLLPALLIREVLWIFFWMRACTVLSSRCLWSSSMAHSASKSTGFLQTTQFRGRSEYSISNHQDFKCGLCFMDSFSTLLPLPIKIFFGSPRMKKYRTEIKISSPMTCLQTIGDEMLLLEMKTCHPQNKYD